MTTFVPRPPYSKEELEKLYPKTLELQLVQVLLRHDFKAKEVLCQRAFKVLVLLLGYPDWPYCSAAKRMSSVMMTNKEASTWDDLQWRRRLETFGDDDGPIVASGPNGEVDGVCQLGDLTDQGRATTLALGQRLRHLYVDQLGFMPKLISDADMVYLRATPISRALDSVQQSFWGLYPRSARTASFPPPTIITRTPADETLFPNDGNCRRFSQLSRAFAQRTADKWNDTEEMDYLNKLISKWMPPSSQRVAVDSHPRLSGIMDTINSTLAHGPKTRLPPEFYDRKGRDIIDRIGTEEWFAGYKESQEYRSLGIGAMVGDLVGRMTGSVQKNGNDGLLEIAGEDGALGTGRGGEKNIKFAMSGCHDTTLAAMLASLGAFEGTDGKWPPYTSHIALELFRKSDKTDWTDGKTVAGRTSFDEEQRVKKQSTARRGLWASLFGPTTNAVGEGNKAPEPEGIARKTMEALDAEERGQLRGFYVRIRYNDRPVTIPGCRFPGNHLEGDESFCTLEAFKSIVDKFTPKNWKQACASNIDMPAFPNSPEPAGT